MNFLHIHTTDIAGGAAISMQRLHQAFKKEGHGSRIYCGHKFSNDEDTYPVVPGRYGYYVNETVGRGFNGIGLQGFGNPSGFWLRNSSLIREWADVIVLKNLHGHYFPLEVLPSLAKHKPIIWRLADMWPLTGHCIYSYACDRWKTGCGECPILEDYPSLPFDTTHFLWKHKKKIYQQLRNRMVIVSPSRWLQKVVQESPLLGDFPCEYIPTAVEMNIFEPGRKEDVRSRLGINKAAKIIMMSSVHLSDPRKGRREIVDFIEDLVKKSSACLTLLLIGNVPAEVAEMLRKSIEVLAPGFIAEDKILVSYYQAADVYVSLSRADNLPNTLVEAAACGLPAVTLDRGGCKETVVQNESGYAVENLPQVVDAVLEILRDEPRQKSFSARARELAQERFSMDSQLKAYVNLANTLQQGQRS